MPLPHNQRASGWGKDNKRTALRILVVDRLVTLLHTHSRTHTDTHVRVDDKLDSSGGFEEGWRWIIALVLPCNSDVSTASRGG